MEQSWRQLSQHGATCFVRKGARTFMIRATHGIKKTCENNEHIGTN